MKTAMAIFKNEKQAIEWQLIGDEDDL